MTCVLYLDYDLLQMNLKRNVQSGSTCSVQFLPSISVHLRCDVCKTLLLDGILVVFYISVASCVSWQGWWQ